MTQQAPNYVYHFHGFVTTEDGAKFTMDGLIHLPTKIIYGDDLDKAKEQLAEEHGIPYSIKFTSLSLIHEQEK